MKKFNFVLSFFLLYFLILTPANSQWVQLTGSPYYTTYCLAMNGSTLLGGTAYTGVYSSTNYGLNWTQIGLNTRYVYSIVINGSNIFAGTSAGVFLSTNNGTNWTQTGGMSLYISKIVINGSYIFAGIKALDSGIVVSTNNGQNWTFTSMHAHYITGLVQIGSNLLAGTYQNGIYLSSNNGLNWTLTTANNLDVYDISVSGANCFAACNNTPAGFGGVYISTNGGYNWTQTSLSNLAIGAVYADGPNVFAGSASTNGIFVSTNYGSNWVPRNQGFTSYSTDYCFLKAGSYIFVTTHYDLNWRRLYSESIGIKNISEIVPSSYSLYQNYPNPFNPETNIKFDIPKSDLVKIKVYDMLGNEVAVLVNEQLQPGTYEITFDGSNLSSGIYFYKLQIGNFIETKKMLMIK